MRPATIHDILQEHRQHRPRAAALSAPGRAALSYDELLTTVEQLGAHLRARGLSHEDRVAIVLPNGPDMAAAFVAVASVSVAAPLNPAYREAEFDFYLSDLGIRAVIIDPGLPSAAVPVAHRLGLRLIELSSDAAAPAGRFAVRSDGKPNRGKLDGLPTADDTALLLHTSGTTARPKVVPLSHRNLCVAARHIAETLHLTPADRGLNVMPLFHVHGLVGSLLSTLWAGASVACTPGFDETQFFAWVRQVRPTWYTAVPTMHQAVVRAAGAPAADLDQTLRFARSASWALAPRTARELATTLRVPVIEAYGMTEAGNQICCNPLPPGQVKLGSVGPAAGPQVAIVDAAGRRLGHGAVGEVVIRGDNVTRGYENNPDANAHAFTDGWFHTGDEGYLDPDGYLFLKGRRKEIINRGGENVSPREIDEALMEHPAVSHAVAFAVPHPTLGEDIAAAVVTRPEPPITEADVRAFAFERLADFKVPSQVVFVDEIPRTATGKVQRLGLADQLAPLLKQEFQRPSSPVEESLAAIWCEVLGLEQVGASDNFFACGGDSLRGTQVIARIRSAFGLDLPVTTIFLRPTLKELADTVASAAGQSPAVG